jgi:hypothetical protein
LLPGAVPDYLKGELPGDYGFDTAALSANPKDLERNREAEIINGRWAMLGVLGCLTPELLAQFGVNYPEPLWFKTGASILNGPVDYLGNPGLIHTRGIVQTRVQVRKNDEKDVTPERETPIKKHSFKQYLGPTGTGGGADGVPYFQEPEI